MRDCAYALVEARIKVDGRNDGYQCDSQNTDPYCACMSLIGDERWCHASKGSGDDYVSWGTGCLSEDQHSGSGELCTAWTNCADGQRVECLGEYKVQADEAGVRCLDTGDAIASQDYCQ